MSPPIDEVYRERLAAVFRLAGWSVLREPAAGAQRADVLIRRKDRAFVGQISSANEGRRDRAIPLLAMAIVQAQQLAKLSNGSPLPLAVLGVPSVHESLLRDIAQFADSYAPDVAVGVIDLDGFHWFHGAGLDSLNMPAHPAVRRRRVRVSEQPINLFSDLNQWLLKVLLAPHMPSELLHAPRGEYRNASQLAGAANVSVMSAFRFVRQLGVEGFVDDSAGVLKLVRLDALLQRWAASYLAPVREVPVQWVLRGNADRQLRDAIGQWRSDGRRACLGLFAASDALGMGFVRGVPSYLYLDRLDAKMLKAFGFSSEPPVGPPDVIVRIPAARESVFRAAVERSGIPVSDIVQVWLDAGAHPARGKEQADVIFRRVLQPVVKALR